jgi:Ni/Fe-hydrogenase subunit HybB-like protein
LISALWFASGWIGAAGALTVLAVPAIVLAVLATAYTGFLFAQGLGRDLWQGPHAAVHLIAQSGAAGAAALLIAAPFTGDVPVQVRQWLGWVLAGSLLLHVLILVFDNVLTPSATRHHELAVRTIRSGAFAPLFWGLAVAAGGVLPFVVVLALGGAATPLVIVPAALLALAGSAAWEYIWVEAGQSVPLS